MNNFETVKFLVGAVVMGLVVRHFLRATGQRSRSVALGTIRFLVTRRPVLIAWAVGTVGALTLLLPLALAKGAEWGLVALPFSAFLGLGVAFLLVGPAFMVLRAFEAPPGVPLEQGELVVRTLLANHFLNEESRGGTLLVTSRRFVFRPHRFNVQLTPWTQQLSDVSTLSHAGTNLLLVDAGTPNEQVLALQRAPREVNILREILAQPEDERRRPS